MSSLDIYKLPREKVDVEAIAQGMARYLKMTTEDAEYLSYDPTRRDAIIAELHKQPQVKTSFWPNQFVTDGQDPDEYLVPANAALDELTPPKSFEERVTRFHIAFAASLVYRQFKVQYALADHWDLACQADRRWNEIMREYIATEFAELFPGRVKAVENRAAVAPPNFPPERRSDRTDQAKPSESTTGNVKPNKFNLSDIEAYLNNPSTLLGKHFHHSPPPDKEQDYKGAWEMASYTVRMGEDGVDHEFQIILEALDGMTLPMGREEVEFLLTHSTLIA